MLIYKSKKLRITLLHQTLYDHQEHFSKKRKNYQIKIYRYNSNG